MARRNTANEAPPDPDERRGQLAFAGFLGEAPSSATPAAAAPVPRAAPRPSEATAAMARRLKAAREQAGYETASAAALAFGWTPSKYLAHEAGERALSAKAVQFYAEAFAVDPAWLAGEARPAAPPAMAPSPRMAPSAVAPAPAFCRPAAPAEDAAPSEAMLRAARDAVFRLAAERGLVPQSVPWDQALSLAEAWREIADAAVRAAWSARK